MAAPDNSKASIERQMEETRARLSQNIDQLVYRANPKTIVGRQVDEVKAFFVASDGQPRTDNIIKVAGGIAAFVTALVIVRKIVS